MSRHRSQREVWLSLSPDPNLILGMPRSDASGAVPPRRRISSHGARARLGRAISPSRTAGRSTIVRGAGSTCSMPTGRRVSRRGQQRGARRPLPSARGPRGAATDGRAQHEHPLPARRHRPLRRAALRDCCRTRCRVCFFVVQRERSQRAGAADGPRPHRGSTASSSSTGAYHGNTTSLVENQPVQVRRPGRNAAARRTCRKVPMPDVYRGPTERDLSTRSPATPRRSRRRGRGRARRRRRGASSAKPL